MLSVSLAFWFPSLTGYSGLRKWVAWVIAFDTLLSGFGGQYGVRLRLFGFTATIDVYIPKKQQKRAEISVSAATFAPNGEKTEVVMSEESKDYYRNLLALGVRMVIHQVSEWNSVEKSFKIPTNMAEQLEIGNRVQFGDDDSGFIVAITGSRKLEDDTTLLYAKFAQYANPKLNTK